MRKYKVFIFIVTACFIYTAWSYAFEWRSVTNNTFKVGEKITYVIKYGFIRAGYATLGVESVEEITGRKAWHIVSTAKTNKVMDIIFKVRDKNESWIDIESFCSLAFGQKLSEGVTRKNTYTVYDHKKGEYYYTKHRVKKGKESNSVREGEMPAFVQDVLSSLYYVRIQDLAVGGAYEFDANSGGKTWPMKVHVHKRCKVRVPAGKFNCLKIEPIMAGDGIFQKKKEGKLIVWVTDDDKKIPVLLRSKVLVGSFDAEMISYE